MVFLAFLAGIAFMSVSIACAVYVTLVLFERPAVRLAVLRAVLDAAAPFFPAIAVVDIEGVERLIQFSALRESLLRIARGQVARSEHYDA